VTLNDAAIRAAKPFTTIWDSKLRGFGLSTGKVKKSFIVLVGSGRRHTIGAYPLCSLAEARALARTMLAEKTLGRVRPKFTAFEDAREAFLKDCETRERPLSPLTIKVYRGHLTRHYPFGRSSVGDISPRDITRNLNLLNDRPSEKEHAARVGRTFFKWCVGEHLIEHSPMDKVKRPANQPSRERTLSEDELAKVYRTALASSSTFHRLVLAIIHTGGRRTETARLEWPYIGETVIFRADTTKGKRDHVLPVGPKAQKIFASFPRIDDSPYVFPASREHVRGTPTSFMTGYSVSKRHFDAECGVSGWTLHDLRRTMVSLMCDNLDIAPHIADRIIAHKGNQPSGAAAIYNRAKYLRQMHEALVAWEDYLERLLSGYRSPSV